MAPAKTKEKKYLAQKPGKEKLFIKQGTKEETLGEAIKSMKGGEARVGFLGGNILRQPDYVPAPEYLNEDEKARKQAIQNLLINTIEPNSLSGKSTPALDKRSMVQKLNKSTLDELRRMLPAHLERVPTEKLKSLADGQTRLTDEEMAEIQDLYKDVSP